MDDIRRNENGDPIYSPTIDDVMGLYPKKKMYRHAVVAGQINIFDILVDSEKRICGGEYWVELDHVDYVHKDDIVDFKIVDKNNVTGLFDYYGLVVGQDVLILSEFVLSDIIRKGSKSNCFYSQLYEGIKGTNKVIQGLFFRVVVDSHGTNDFEFLWRLYFYE